VHAFSNPVSNNPSASNRTYTFEFDLPIETGGKRHKRIDNAQSQLHAAEAQVLDAIRNQLFQMKTLYYAAVLARENEKVAAEVLESVDKTEALIKRQVGAGNTPEAQLITFQANRITFEQPLIAAQLSYEQSIRDLLNILAAKPEDVIGAPAVPDAKPRRLSSIELAGTLDVEQLAVTLEDLRLKTEERPDVIAAQRSVEAAERNVTLSHALRSPDITVGTQYARVGSDNTAGMSFTVPLPLFNNKEGEITQAESQLRTARVQLKQTKLQALTDVDKAFRGYEMNLQVLRLYDETAIKRAKESLDIAEKSYERGATSLLEVLDARRTYRQTLVARDQARFNLRQSIVQLEQASGTALSK
jgi:cobalt-zinc-cadmium efflux system outer membrane protein